MAILYSFKKEKDKFILEVEQETVYTLRSLSTGTAIKVSTGTLMQGIPTIIPIYIDGEYEILLEAGEETSLITSFFAFNRLQNSLIEDIEGIICEDDCNSCGAKDTECLTIQSFFVKALSFETLFIPSYGADYPLIFTSFLNSGVQTVSCKVQGKVNKVLATECIKGKIDEEGITNLSTIYAALYWAGLYFIEENLAVDEEQLDFVKEKFKYDTLVSCLCNLCLDIEELRTVFTVDPTNLQIISFQFNGTQYDINDIALLTNTYLAENGEVQPEGELLGGKQIGFTTVGRVGFVINNTINGRYRIFDVLENDITEIVFDHDYNSDTLTETYVSKEYYVPSSVYFKFIKQ